MTGRPQGFEITPKLAAELGGRWLGAPAPVRIYGASIDSRKITPGCLFACLEGSRSDGHDHADTAVGDGAALVLASRELEEALPVPVIIVADVAVALAELARRFRAAYTGATWIGITGSNGKTTVKELLAAACRASAATHSTAGNYNNELGVPLSILATPPEQTFVIIEMGASGPGDIAHLAALARPRIGVITGIGPAHLEGFGDLAGVARGKSELFAALPADGQALISRYGLQEASALVGASADELLAIVSAAAGSRRLAIIGGVGLPISGHLLDDGLVLETPVGEVQLRLNGSHNLSNALVAWHAAVAAGVEPGLALRGLATVRPGSGRLQVRRLRGHRLFDDSYNANPASMEAGLEVLARQPGARLAVLGRMLELGAESEAQHRRVGAYAARLGLPLCCVAAPAIGIGYREAGGRDQYDAADVAAAVEFVLARLAVGPTAVLIKASRSAGLDRVVQAVASRLGFGSGDDEDAAC